MKKNPTLDDIVDLVIPESDMVKMVLIEEFNRDIDDWEKEIKDLINRSLNGDHRSLMELLEIVRTSSFNEGELNYAADQKAG